MRLKDYTHKILLAVVASLLICSISAIVVGSGIPLDRLQAGIKSKLGVSPHLYGILELNYQGNEALFIIIYINKKTMESSLSSEIKNAISPYTSKPALLISVLSKSKETELHPYSLRIIQDKHTFTINSIKNITSGFSKGRLSQSLSVGMQQFWGAKGIVTLNESLTIQKPLTVTYGNNRITLGPSTTSSPSSVTEKSQTNRENSTSSVSKQDTSGLQLDQLFDSPDEREQGAFLLGTFLHLLLLTIGL